MNSSLKFLIFLLLVFAGCASNFIVNTEFKELHQTYPNDSVYITNPELTKELEILKYSSIFIFSDDSLNASKITLLPLQEQTVMCATPIALTFFTIGLFPGKLPYQYDFGFYTFENAQPCTTKISVEGKERISFWDFFAKPFINEEEQIGIGVKHKFQNKELGWKENDWMVVIPQNK